MRGAGLVTLAMAALLSSALASGCASPSAGAEPERASVGLAPRVVDGERRDANATVVVSALPEEAAAVLSPDRPMNCFQVETDTGEKTYLGGAVLELTWTAASSVTENLTVTASNGPVATWRTSGTSPLRLNPVPSEDEMQTVSLPMLVEVVPTGAGALELKADQEIHLHVVVGLLESLIESLVVKQAACP